MELSNYKIGQLLGSGSFGEVRLAVEKSTGRKVAIKAMSKGSVQDISEVERVSREFYILTALDHKNVIRLYEVLQSETHLYLVMEYAGGGSLDSWLTKAGGQAPDERSARKMFTQILSAVRYCHRKRIIHRDLKPENILLTTANAIKVADFGLSNTVAYGGRARSPVGTPLYAAPEVLFPQMYPELDAMFSGVKAGEEGGAGRRSSLPSIPSAPQLTDAMAGLPGLPSVSPTEEGGGADKAQDATGAPDDGAASNDAPFPGTLAMSKGQYTPGCADVWSLGVILHRLVFGCLPYQANSIRELKNLIFNTTWHPPSSCSPALHSLLKGMLERDPLQRMSAEAVSAHPWTEAGGRGSLPSLQLEEIAARAREEHIEESSAAGEVAGSEPAASARGGDGTATPLPQASALPPTGAAAEQGSSTQEGQFQLPSLDAQSSTGSNGGSSTARPRAGTGGSSAPAQGMQPESPTAAAAASAGRITPRGSAAAAAAASGSQQYSSVGSGATHGPVGGASTGAGSGAATALPMGSPAGGMFPLFISPPAPGSESGASSSVPASATPAVHIVRARRASISHPAPTPVEQPNATADATGTVSRPGSASGGVSVGDEAELLPAASTGTSSVSVAGGGGRQGGGGTDAGLAVPAASPATQQAHIPSTAGSAIQFLRYGSTSSGGGSSGAAGPGRLGSTLTPARRGSLLGATPLSMTTPVQGLGSVGAGRTPAGGVKAGGSLKRDTSGDLAHATATAAAATIPSAGGEAGGSSAIAAAIGPVRDPSFLRKAAISSNASLFASEVGAGAGSGSLPSLVPASHAGDQHHIISPTAPAAHPAPLGSPLLPEAGAGAAVPRAQLPPAQLAAAARQAIASLHPIQANAATGPKLGDGPGVAQPRRASLVGKLAPIPSVNSAGSSAGNAHSATPGSVGAATVSIADVSTSAKPAGMLTAAKVASSAGRTSAQPLLTSPSGSLAHPSVAEKSNSASTAGSASPSHGHAAEAVHAPLLNGTHGSTAVVHAAGSAAAIAHARRASLTTGQTGSTGLLAGGAAGSKVSSPGSTALPSLGLHTVTGTTSTGGKQLTVQNKTSAR